MTTLDSVFMYCTPALTVTRLRAQLSEQKMPQEHTPHRMQPQVDGSCVPGASYRPLSVPGSAVSMRLTALRPAEQCYGACSHDIELRRRNRAEAPQEHTPHQMQPQVNSCCAPDASYRTLTVPGTAATHQLTALRPAEQCCGACSHDIELRRRNRAEAPQEHTPRRMQPQVNSYCAPDAPRGSLTVPGTTVTMRLTAWRPA